MLERRRWYRNPGGGVLEVERVMFTGADIRIYQGIRRVVFESNGKNIGFIARKITRMTISSGSVLELATADEVKRFTTNGKKGRLTFK